MHFRLLGGATLSTRILTRFRRVQSHVLMWRAIPIRLYATAEERAAKVEKDKAAMAETKNKTEKKKVPEEVKVRWSISTPG